MRKILVSGSTTNDKTADNAGGTDENDNSVRTRVMREIDGLFHRIGADKLQAKKYPQIAGTTLAAKSSSAASRPRRMLSYLPELLVNDEL